MSPCMMQLTPLRISHGTHIQWTHTRILDSRETRSGKWDYQILRPKGSLKHEALPCRRQHLARRESRPRVCLASFRRVQVRPAHAYAMRALPPCMTLHALPPCLGATPGRLRITLQACTSTNNANRTSHLQQARKRTKRSRPTSAQANGRAVTTHASATRAGTRRELRAVGHGEAGSRTA